MHAPARLRVCASPSARAHAPIEVLPLSLAAPHSLPAPCARSHACMRADTTAARCSGRCCGGLCARGAASARQWCVRARCVGCARSGWASGLLQRQGCACLPLTPRLFSVLIVQGRVGSVLRPLTALLQDAAAHGPPHPFVVFPSSHALQGLFWSAHQRFFKMLLMASKVAACAKLAQDAINDGGWLAGWVVGWLAGWLTG